MLKAKRPGGSGDGVAAWLSMPSYGRVQRTQLALGLCPTVHWYRADQISTNPDHHKEGGPDRICPIGETNFVVAGGQKPKNHRTLSAFCNSHEIIDLHQSYLVRIIHSSNGARGYSAGGGAMAVIPLNRFQLPEARLLGR